MNERKRYARNIGKGYYRISDNQDFLSSLRRVGRGKLGRVRGVVRTVNKRHDRIDNNEVVVKLRGKIGKEKSIMDTEEKQNTQLSGYTIELLEDEKRIVNVHASRENSIKSTRELLLKGPELKFTRP